MYINLWVSFKLKSVCIIKNIYFNYLLLSKINITLCSKCKLFQMRKKFKPIQLVTNRSFKIHVFFSKMRSQICAKLFHHKTFFLL